MTDAEQYAGIGMPDSRRLVSAFDGMVDLVGLCHRALEELGYSRVLEGLRAFHSSTSTNWHDCFLAYCDGPPGRLRARCLVNAELYGRDIVGYEDVAHLMKIHERSVRVLCYLHDRYPRVLQTLARDFVRTYSPETIQVRRLTQSA